VSQFLVDRWLPARNARGLKPTTLASYEWVVKTYVIPRVGELKLAEVRPYHVTAMLVALGNEPGRGGRRRSARTVELTRRVLSMAFADAMRWGLSGRNPVEAAEADLPRHGGGRRAPHIWTPVELRSFLASVRNDRLYALWLLAATTGMRRGELCGLEWGDVDLDAARLTVRRNRVMVGGRAATGTPKTGAGQRTVSLDAVTVEVLRSWATQVASDKSRCPSGHWRESPHVFTDVVGRPLFPESVTKRFAALVRECGVPKIRLHDLRHSYATAALQAGVNIEILADRLGHSTSAVTRAIYLHPVEELDREAASVVSRLILGGGVKPAVEDPGG
jgi:integrase